MAEIFRRTSHITGPPGASVVPGYPITCGKKSFFSTRVLKHPEEHKQFTEAKREGISHRGLVSVSRSQKGWL